MLISKLKINAIISGILPRRSNYIRKEKVQNELLSKKMCENKIHYLEHDEDWANKDGSINPKFYYTDQLHLIDLGTLNYQKRALKWGSALSKHLLSINLH